MKSTVIYHSADFDGIFCREIARKFLPDAKLIGWDHGDAKIPFPTEGTVYVLDLAPNCFQSTPQDTLDRLIWIDHHKSSIENWPTTIPGYRIDGVAACRLAWQWFALMAATPNPEEFALPDKQHFFDRQVYEPKAVQLAGEYDIWDKRNPDAETFQFGLRSCEFTPAGWGLLLTPFQTTEGNGVVDTEIEKMIEVLLFNGRILQKYQQEQDASLMSRTFIMDFEGLRFLILNTARCNSLTFAAKDVPETGHDALMGFFWNGQKWKVSLYSAKHRRDLDLSVIAVKYGGGGHKGACGFECQALPFIP